MTTSASQSPNVIRLIHRAMEALWLAIVILVPLAMAPSESMISYIQLPKIALLRTLVSIMTMLWVVEWALSPRSTKGLRGFSGFAPIKQWLKERPTRLVLVTALAFMGVYILSTILSTSRSVSIWGNASDADNYGLYNMLAYFALFLIVATHLRTQNQLWRLIAAIAGVGVVSSTLGVLEYLQLIPLGEVRPANPRITATFGNAIFFAAFLVMTIPISVALFFNRWSWWQSLDIRARYSVGVAAVGVQMLALLLTLSRGPWVGLAAGLAVFFVMMAFVAGKGTTLKSVLLIIPAFALAVVAMQTLPTPEKRNPDDTSQRADDFAFEDRLLSLYGEVAGGGLNNRILIWKSSGRLIADHPWFPSDELPMPYVRPILGYGPALYAYVFPLEAIDFIGFQYHAHNHVIHEAVEIGYLGALAYLLFIATIFVAGTILFRKKESFSHETGLIVVVIMAAVGARFVEQLVGIAKVGDFTIFWVILGILVAFPAIMPGNNGERQAEPFPVNFPTLFDARTVAKLGLAAIVIIGLGALIFTRNLNHVRADVAMAKAYQTRSFKEAISYADRATELAPYQSNYFIRGYDIVQHGLRDADSVEENVKLAEKAYVNATIALKKDPLSTSARLKVANASLDLGRLGYEGMTHQAIDHYRQLIDTTPRMDLIHNHLWVLMAIAYIESDSPELALQNIERINKDKLEADERARTFYLQGVAQNELDLVQEAVASLERTLAIDFEGDSNIKAEAHLLLSRLYMDAGDTIRSEVHSRLHDDLAGRNDS